MAKVRDWGMMAFVLTIAATTSVQAAPDKPAAIADTQTPQATTATYQDWTVRCDIRDAAKTCEMAQAMQIKGQPQPVTQIAIGQQSKTSPMKIVFQVPINVALGDGPRLVVDDKDPGIAAAYRRCVPVACFADADLKDDQIKKLKGLSENGKLQFRDAADQLISIPVSFKGFDQAFDAMLKR
ncbi:invasion associated locus B family protein [Rhodopseudomonas palustris]|uniref:invasion associated locus B family protein n=1 Tax=Rhodopseudomonas palustris TaxID=1076 RepID=UPI00069B8763|nr:invasion associated locus B family protein [Rhodopseudomonas palustris]